LSLNSIPFFHKESRKLLNELQVELVVKANHVELPGILDMFYKPFQIGKCFYHENYKEEWMVEEG
jgi:hypothetical protein